MRAETSNRRMGQFFGKTVDQSPVPSPGPAPVPSSGPRPGNALGAMALLGAIALGGLGAAGCDDGMDGPDVPPDAPLAEQAVLVAERVFTPTSRLYYVSVLAEVPTGPIDRSKAIELTSADIDVYNGFVYIRNRDANTMTRYRVGAARNMVKDAEFSFASTGLGTGRYNNVFVSDTLAYALDSAGFRLVGWNPQSMELTGDIISIESMAKPPLPGGAIGSAVKVGNRLIAPVYWANFATRVMYPGVGALIIDPSKPDEPTLIEDARIGGAFRVSTTANGDAYVTGIVGADFHTFGSALGGGALPTSGVLRLAAGADAFDPSYLVDISAITQSDSVWAVHRIDDNRLLVQAYDPASELPANVQDFAASTDFVYGYVDVAAGTFTQIPTLPKGGRGNAGNHIVDDKLYIQSSTATGTNVYQAGASGISEAFTVPSGDLWHMQRLR